MEIKQKNKKKHNAESLMIDLMYQVTEELMRRISEPDASPSDIRNAISLLKDNNITVDIKEGEILSIVNENKDDPLPFEAFSKEAD
jgi:hypothetical protein